MPARYIGRLSASELDFEMTVLSRSKNAASTTLVSYASRFESPPGSEPSRSGRLALILDIGGVRAPGGPPGLQNRCAGDELAGGFDSRPPPLHAVLPPQGEPGHRSEASACKRFANGQRTDGVTN